MSPFDIQIEHLTRKAVKAANDGRWNTVEEVYRYRMESGLLEKASPQLVKKLIEWDQWVMAKAKEVHAATGQHLNNLQDRRRKVAGLKRQWVGKTPVYFARLIKTV